VLHLAVQGFFLPEQDLEAIVGDELEEEGDGDEAGEVEIKEVEMPFMESVLLRAGLALAGANGVGKGYQPPPEAEDGLLTAEEVSGLDLYETELVVLTGTDAGPGDADVGPAVLGLRRAFTLAGARTLVLSLWRVPGLVTAILAERFYANLLKKKLGRAESLREAQTYVRDVTVGELKPCWLTEQVRRQAAKHEPTLKYLQKLAGQPDEAQPFRHPRYWGAFICQGDWNPLP
jgi:CHAT domain-containing protein